MAHEQYQRHPSILDITNFKKGVVMWSYKNFIDFIVISDGEFISIEASKTDPKEYVNHWKYFNE